MASRPRKKAPATRAQRTEPLGPTTRGEGAAKAFTTKPIPIEFAGPEHRFVRADIEIDGIYHGEASYNGLIFLNRPDADATTPRDATNGYAGRFSIFGHGGCLGDPGHCDVDERERDPFDFRQPHPLTLASKRITVTGALKEIAKMHATVTITVVPIVTASNRLCDPKDVFRCKDIRILTYNA